MKQRGNKTVECISKYIIIVFDIMKSIIDRYVFTSFTYIIADCTSK